MKEKFNNFKIAVDSETGIYWHGDRCLRNQAQINALIRQAANEKARVKDCVIRGQNPLYFSALKIVRITASCFGVNSLRKA